MLTGKFSETSSIIIVSTIIQAEMPRRFQKLIIIDKGNVRFFDAITIG